MSNLMAKIGSVPWRAFAAITPGRLFAGSVWLLLQHCVDTDCGYLTAPPATFAVHKAFSHFRRIRLCCKPIIISCQYSSSPFFVVPEPNLKLRSGGYDT